MSESRQHEITTKLSVSSHGRATNLWLMLPRAAPTKNVSIGLCFGCGDVVEQYCSWLTLGQIDETLKFLGNVSERLIVFNFKRHFLLNSIESHCQDFYFDSKSFDPFLSSNGADGFPASGPQRIMVFSPIISTTFI